MNILIIGSGAREHAIALALHRSSQQPQLFCCASSHHPGILSLTTQSVVTPLTDIIAISQFAKQWQIDLAIIGPEAPLEVGLADALWQLNIPTIGPKKNLAQIETSKTFARHLMQKYHIPGMPKYRSFNNLEGVTDFLAELGDGKYVVKANGLMGGKGVKVAGDHLHSFYDAIVFCREIIAQHQSFVIEEKFIGQEFSFMCFCDGETLIPMPLVQDHKRAYVNDRGPNTGGMGSYSAPDHSLPFLRAQDKEQAFAINQAIIQALTQECGEKYIGILYGSFIATQHGVGVIEFNARFGDPESLNVLSILQSDFVEICEAMVKGKLSSTAVLFSPQATVCKYVVPEGYPDHPLKNVEIEICEVADKNYLYLAAVNQENNKLLATGSRTAAYVGVADTISAAEKIAEQEISKIHGPLFHREDIGTDQLIAQRIAAMEKLRSETCA